MQAIEAFPGGDNETNLQFNADNVAVRVAVLERVSKSMGRR